MNYPKFTEKFFETTIVIGQSSLNFQLGTVLDLDFSTSYFQTQFATFRKIYEKEKTSKEVFTISVSSQSDYILIHI